MYEISQNVINRLTPNQLEEIFIFNKLKIQGFRVEGPANPVKTQRMRTLLINNPKLELILKKTAEEYKTKKNKDFTWALVETIDLDLVKRKIDETDISEVAYALIDADKLGLLKDILVPKTEGIYKNNVEKDSDQSNHSQSARLEETIADLRSIIKNLEGKNQALDNSLNLVREELTKLKQENAIFKTKNIEIKEELDKLNEKHNKTIQTLYLTNDKKNKLENDLVNLKLEKEVTRLEIEKMSVLNILFYGTNVYRRYIDNKVSKLKCIKYKYVYGRNEVENYVLYQKLIVLKFTLTNLELEDLVKQKYLNHFGDLRNLIFIESLEELNEYIEKVGNYYE